MTLSCEKIYTTFRWREPLEILIRFQADDEEELYALECEAKFSGKSINDVTLDDFEACELCFEYFSPDAAIYFFGGLICAMIRSGANDAQSLRNLLALLASARFENTFGNLRISNLALTMPEKEVIHEWLANLVTEVDDLELIASIDEATLTIESAREILIDEI